MVKPKGGNKGMLKTTVAVIGEGPTEFYYMQSLGDLFRGITIKPDFPKHSSLSELDNKISECVGKGFRFVMCIMDMDNKDNPSEKQQYDNLRRKYNEAVRDKKTNDITCEVLFYETHRCTELFFLYYFVYTTQYFRNQESLLELLKGKCGYEKSIDFFRKCHGLHTYFCKYGGDLDLAVENADRSLKQREYSDNNYTYSELGKLIVKLNEIKGERNLK